MNLKVKTLYCHNKESFFQLNNLHLIIFQGLAHTLGQYFVSLSCTPKMDFGQVAKILTGLAQVCLLLLNKHFELLRFH